MISRSIRAKYWRTTCHSLHFGIAFSSIVYRCFETISRKIPKFDRYKNIELALPSYYRKLDQSETDSYAARVYSEPTDGSRYLSVKAGLPRDVQALPRHPLGPVFLRAYQVRPATTRIAAAVVFMACVGLVSIAAALTPDPSGMGTHRQLGLPPCSMVALVGYPCPSCGMTTAFAYTVRGKLLSAFLAQPTGLVLALVTIAAMIVSCAMLVSGKAWSVNWYRVPPARLAFCAVLLLLAGWGFNIAFGVFSGTLPVP